MWMLHKTNKVLTVVGPSQQSVYIYIQLFQRDAIPTVKATRKFPPSPLFSIYTVCSNLLCPVLYIISTSACQKM